MLTVIVELFVIKGDIGRMNTVFKFYLQAWTLLALGSAYLLHHLLKYLSSKTPHNQLINIWITVLVLLMSSVLLFTLTASIDKVTDRMGEDTPITLDGMSYMQYSTYMENDVLTDLSQDFQAIQWLQANIEGTHNC